jgi:hypothetical protein
VDAEIVIVGTEHHVRALADRAFNLRQYLLSRAVPCGPVELPEGSYQSFRLGKTANLGAVQAILDRWAAAGRTPTN